MKIIGVDAGKFGTKSVSRNEQGSISKSVFRTKVDEESLNLPQSESSFRVKYGSNLYLVGEDAQTVDYDLTKTKLHHKLTAYVAVTRHITPDRTEVVLPIGCPLSMFKNAGAKEEFKNFIKGDGQVYIEVNNEQFYFTIKDVVPLPESLGVPYKNPTIYKDKLTAVIDIGGLNTNGAIYQGLKPIKETIFTINEGATILQNKIKNRLISDMSMCFQDYEIPNILKNGVYVNGVKSEGGSVIVDSIIDEHMNAIVQEMKKNNWNIKGLDVVVIGGGSILLKDSVLQYVPQATFSETPVWDNAIAFQKVGELLYGQK